jgi:WD40 repeat protein/serine/threonine protein kinase
MSGETDKPGTSVAETIFFAALPLSSSERTDYLAGACGDNEQLRQRVEALLRVHDAPKGFLPEEPSQPPPETPTLSNFLAAQLTEKPGDQIGRYVLRGKIGEGGCGVVYMAEQEQPVRRRVALKVIKLGMDTRQVVARFEAERQALALMDHPNIARVIDAGATDTGRPYFVMELVGGIKITDYCEQNQFDTRQRLDLFIQVCRAIQHAHQKGVIHRDIKPSNVLVATQDGVPVPKVIDFGIAKATQGRLTDQTVFTAFEQFLGTPAYMSPEQAQLGGLDVDTRSDIYSLGVLLYELLTGKTPFDTKELLASGLDGMRRTIQEREPLTPSTRLKQDLVAAEVRRLSSKSELRNPKSEMESAPSRRLLQDLVKALKGDLDWIVMKCLEKERARRYPTANGLATDIDRHLKNEPVTARPPSRLYEFQKTVRRHKFGFAATASVIVVLLLGIGGVFSEFRRAERHVLLEKGERSRAQEALAQMQAIEVRRAEEYYLADDRRNMLPYLALVLRQNPTNPIAAERLFSTLSHRNWARLACPPMMHSNRVTFALFSNDGTRVVTSSSDNTACVWDAATGQRVAGPFVHAAEINFALLSEDGRFVVTTSKDKTARVWNVATGVPVTAPLPHSNDVSMAFFVLDGKHLFTVSGNDGQLWSVDSAQRVGVGFKCPEWVLDARPSPDGSCVALACSGGNVEVCDLKSNQFRHRFRHTDNARWVAFSPDGRRLITASDDKTARIWDMETGQPVGEPLQHSSYVSGAEFSPDGQHIVTSCSDNTAQVWDANTSQKVGPPLRHNDYVRMAMFSPEGLRVATASSDSTVRVWDALTGEPLTEPLSQESGAFLTQFHTDGQRLLTACNGKAVLIWQMIGVPALALHFSASVSGLEFSPDGKKIVVASDASNTRVWDALTGQPLTPPLTHPPGASINQAVFSPDGKRIATAADDRTARIWNAANGQLLTGPMLHRENVTALAFSSDGARLLTTSTNVATVWDAEKGARLLAIEHEARLSLAASFSPDGGKLLTATETGVARVYDSRTGEALTPPLSHAAGVTSAQFSPDGRFLLTTARDSSFFIWDMNTGGQLEARWPHRDLVLSAIYTRDGKRVMTSTRAYGVQVWDLDTGVSLIGEFGGRARIGGATFSPRESTVMIPFEENTTELWDFSSGQRLSEVFSHGNGGRCQRRISPDGRLLAVSNSDGRVAIWEVSPPPLPVPRWLPELAEALAGKRFNQKGMLESVQPAELWEVQQRMAAAVSTDVSPKSEFYDRWARWFLAEPNRRTVLPSSPLTLAQHAQSLAGQRVSNAAAKEALLLQPTNVIAMNAVTLTTTNALFGDWLGRHAVELAPDSEAVLWARETFLRDHGRFAEALSAFERDASLWTSNPWVWADKGVTLEKLGRFDDALAAYSRVIELTPNFEEMRILALEHRWQLLKRMNRLPESEKDFVAAKRIPSRPSLAPGSHFRPIDLRPYLNQGLQDFSLSKVMGATNPIAPLRMLAGVEFELCGYIQLAEEEGDPVFPLKVRQIPVGQQTRVLHFLHTSAPSANQKPVLAVGSYVVHYAGAPDETIPIVGAGADVRWYFDTDKELGPDAVEAWNEKNDKGDLVRLFKRSWINPHPEIEIQSIDFLCAGPGCSRPILFAITAEK